ncbi:AT-rich interactive domain-containing 1A-like [Lecanosticta acicola]|uniref:AT-rich interactive domain-containing 1A-like n=1 Tax=Lecanosticta acicola TaxID=111012 RepID=A0AAI9EBF8_9PEZI|nr:AT-rich interactive domain-containing 1A-like [Lecanosticta acicola]
MGLASKLAASQGQAGGQSVANYPPGGQQQPALAGGPAPQSQQYQAFRPQPGYPQQQQPPNQPYGYQASGGYGSPAPGGYSRPPPPPPNRPQGSSPYPGQASPYQQSPYQQSPQPYSPAPYQNQPYPPPQQGYGGYVRDIRPFARLGGPPPSGPPPPGQHQYGGPQQGYPPQGQPQGPPGGYGAPPPSTSGPGDVQGYQRELERAIQEQSLNRFYGPGTPGAQQLPQIAARAAQQVDRLCQAWRIQKEIANDIVRLALYDVVIYIDDSGSMSFEENGERIKDLQLILQRAAFAATLFDDDGVEIRFMNEDLPVQEISNIRSEQQIEQILSRKRYKGLTPFGTELRRKVIDPILIPKLNSGQMRKPLLIISITDGQPAGENQNALVETVQYAVQAAQRSQYGTGAVAFQFAQVGNDQKAAEFLAKLDNDPMVGREVDCTSNYENESAEMARANPPVDLTPDLWMIKLILGAIDPSYDTKDEKTSMGGGMPGGMPPGPGGYGPGPGQYQQGPPPGQNYGAPPNSQYGGPPPNYGGPQQGYPPQQGYGRPPGPPQGGAYPGQQPGGYAPGPPRY